MRLPSDKVKHYNQGNIRRLSRKKNELEEKGEIFTVTEGKTLVTEQPFRVGLTQLEVLTTIATFA